MFQLGDLVRRIKILSVTDIDYEWIEYENPNDEFGIVVDIEEPIHQTKLLNLNYPEVFVKVYWQGNDSGALWHWGDEITIVKRANKG
jgi:hypothetical protein